MAMRKRFVVIALWVVSMFAAGLWAMRKRPCRNRARRRHRSNRSRRSLQGTTSDSEWMPAKETHLSDASLSGSMGDGLRLRSHRASGG